MQNDILQDAIPKGGDVALSMMSSDIDAYSKYFEQSNLLMDQVLSGNDTAVAGIISNPSEIQPAISDSVALAYFNRYQQVIKGIVDEGTLTFDDQTIQDMQAYGSDEPAIIYAGTMAGQNFYGFMTSPETYENVKQGILNNVDASDQARQLEILDLLKVDAERMVRDFPREMDGPTGDAQAVHLAFVQTINPDAAPQVLEDIGINTEIAERIASNVVMSMPEPDLIENFTAPAEVDPTIPVLDSAPSKPTAPLLASATEGDAVPVVDNTTPEIVLAAEKEVVEVTPDPQSQTYEIQHGDTLSKIVADHYGLTEWSDIQRVYETVARNNGIKDPDLIYTGNNLVLFDDPTVDLFPESKTASSDFNVAFNASAEGLVAANSPEAPVVRPQPRPADLLAPAA